MTSEHKRRPASPRGTAAQVFARALAHVKPIAVPPQSAQRVKRELALRIHAQRSAAQLVTVRAQDAGWIALTPLIDILPLTRAGTVYSFLLRMQAGAQLPAHDHPEAEECLVLRGEGIVGDVLLRAGDYQFAPKGTRHGIATTTRGVLLYVRGSCPALDRTNLISAQP